MGKEDPRLGDCDDLKIKTDVVSDFPPKHVRAARTIITSVRRAPHELLMSPKELAMLIADDGLNTHPKVKTQSSTNPQSYKHRKRFIPPARAVFW